MRQDAAVTVEDHRDLRYQDHVDVLTGQARVGGDEPGVPAHQLDQADAAGGGAGLGVSGADGVRRPGERRLETEALVDPGDVVVDRLGNSYDRQGHPPAVALARKGDAPRSVPSPPITNR